VLSITYKVSDEAVTSLEKELMVEEDAEEMESDSEEIRLVCCLGFTQPLTEISTRNIKIIMFLESKVWRVHRAVNLTTIYEPIV
jgi:hypothetical protein